MYKRRKRSKRVKRGKRYRQHGGALFDIQKLLNSFGRELHVPGYQFLGPGTHLKKRLKRGDMGINRLDRIARHHDIDYSMAKNLNDKLKADERMIRSINSLPGKKTLTENIVKNALRFKRALRI